MTPETPCFLANLEKHDRPLITVDRHFVAAIGILSLAIHASYMYNPVAFIRYWRSQEGLQMQDVQHIGLFTRTIATYTTADMIAGAGLGFVLDYIGPKYFSLLGHSSAFIGWLMYQLPLDKAYIWMPLSAVFQGYSKQTLYNSSMITGNLFRRKQVIVLATIGGSSDISQFLPVLFVYVSGWVSPSRVGVIMCCLLLITGTLTFLTFPNCNEMNYAREDRQQAVDREVETHRHRFPSSYDPPMAHPGTYGHSGRVTLPHGLSYTDVNREDPEDSYESARGVHSTTVRSVLSAIATPAGTVRRNTLDGDDILGTEEEKIFVSDVISSGHYLCLTLLYVVIFVIFQFQTTYISTVIRLLPESDRNGLMNYFSTWAPFGAVVCFCAGKVAEMCSVSFVLHIFVVFGTLVSLCFYINSTVSVYMGITAYFLYKSSLFTMLFSYLLDKFPSHCIARCASIPPLCGALLFYPLSRYIASYTKALAEHITLDEAEMVVMSKLWTHCIIAGVLNELVYIWGVYGRSPMRHTSLMSTEKSNEVKCKDNLDAHKMESKGKSAVNLFGFQD